MSYCALNIFKLNHKKTNVFSFSFQILNICSQIFILKSLPLNSFLKNGLSSQRLFLELIYFKLCFHDLNFIFCSNSLVQTYQRLYPHNYIISFKTKLFFSIWKAFRQLIGSDIFLYHPVGGIFIILLENRKNYRKKEYLTRHKKCGSSNIITIYSMKTFQNCRKIRLYYIKPYKINIFCFARS